MGWYDDYKKKCCSIDEAVSVVKSNQRLYISGNAATPFQLLVGISRRKKELKNVEIAHLYLLGSDPLSKPGMAGHFRHNSLFVGPADREAVNGGRADYFPAFLHEIPKIFYSRILLIDTAFVQLSPPDENGFLSLGVECLASKAAVESAGTVVAEVNEKMPRTLGDCFIHISRIKKVVEISQELPEIEILPPTDLEKKIGCHIAALVEDGATLQVGIGGIPNAALRAMYDKKDLGLHTELVSDGIMDAIEAGVITGAKKNIYPGKVIATVYLGTRKLYKFIHNNPLFETRPSDYTNNPFTISKNNNLVAINSAIEIDLTGQVCADSMGSKIYSGFGGQVDFVRGAAKSKGGKSIIALPATAKDGTVSRIVPTLKKGAGVVTSRADVQYVVTEYGTAFLFGKSLRQRAEALINIAHPGFRPMLEREAKARKLL